MKFDVYYPFVSKQGKTCPGVKPVPTEYAKIRSEILASENVRLTIERHRLGDPTAKISLPAICFTGRCTSTRKNSAMIPTQYVMIDIDHCTDAVSAWKGIYETMGEEWVKVNVLLVHLTPSRGLHIFFRAQEGKTSLGENMTWFNEKANFGQYGDFDTAVHDFARLSFAFMASEILYESPDLFLEFPQNIPFILINQNYSDNEQAIQQSAPQSGGTDGQASPADNKDAKSEIPVFSPEEKEKLEQEVYKTTPIRTIVDSWVDYRGEPGANEVHNYYNEMVKFFRNILGNNKRKIFYFLPKFGHTDEECWSQVKSICKSNTLSRLDREFYFFLLDRGFITNNKNEFENTFMLSNADTSEIDKMPTLPPVIREFVNIAPKDFKIPVINALLPVLGTLSSYVSAKYPYDDRIHTTSFFSVIYGPPSAGKGFVGRMKFLFKDIELRDYVQAARQRIYMRAMLRKSQNDKAPEEPHTSLRIIPPKNSEAEFLERQRDNHGYHMFTYAAEMDSWAKGEKAAGGNKSDMIRIAWDNGEYGQQFKSLNTFKGVVKLYWNVLITGTLNQVENYFRDVENGLASRCSFCGIENQEYQIPAAWKKIRQRGMQVIEAYIKRCDENTYQEPCNINPADLDLIADADFDNEVDWRFKFRDRQDVDMSWIMPTIDQFQKEQCKKAALALDPARDTFRRRVGVRGFRLALLCTTLYPHLGPKNYLIIKDFVKWWMEVDLENILKLIGDRYNEQTNKIVGMAQKDVFSDLPKKFNKNDVLAVMRKQGKKTRVNDVIFRWKKIGAIEEVNKGNYKKSEKYLVHETEK